MKSRHLSKFVWAFIIFCTWVGGFLGIYINGKVTGDYQYDLAIPIIVGTVLALIISLFFSHRRKKRNGKVPEIDERTVKIMQRYLMIVLYVVLFGSGTALIILYSMGVQFIETGMLIICLLALYMIIGLGAFVAKRL
ncbi:hypothetical protein ACQKP0_20045 [Heyndrickxia sp. NPDC080065]|uniref:hypothetical protein n=1 Tax=Heyndrickxia sp. NPDC080065 TaxID=3390568 RepID=UPI003D081FF4